MRRHVGSFGRRRRRRASKAWRRAPRKPGRRPTRRRGAAIRRPLHRRRQRRRGRRVRVRSHRERELRQRQRRCHHISGGRGREAERCQRSVGVQGARSACCGGSAAVRGGRRLKRRSKICWQSGSWCSARRRRRGDRSASDCSLGRQRHRRLGRLAICAVLDTVLLLHSARMPARHVPLSFVWHKQTHACTEAAEAAYAAAAACRATRTWTR